MGTRHIWNWFKLLGYGLLSHSFWGFVYKFQWAKNFQNLFHQKNLHPALSQMTQKSLQLPLQAVKIFWSHGKLMSIKPPDNHFFIKQNFW